MENIKAILAVALFVATILFLNHEQEGEHRQPKKRVAEEQVMDTLSLQKDLFRLPR